MANFKAAIKRAGPNSQGQLRPNPGWLSLHPGQRRGHEAPARLNTQHRADGTDFTQPALGPPHSKKAVSKGAAAKSDSQHAAGSSKAAGSYTPSEVGPNKMGLRERKGKPQPPPAPPKAHQPARTAGTSNLRPGRVAPPGHVWHPSTGGPSHFGAPGHLSEAAQRHPPQPQNHQHYTQQLQAAEAKHKAAASGAHRGSSKYLPAQTANLRAFEQQFPARHGGAAGRAHEAPARMQTHVNHSPSHSAPHTRPPSAQGHQSRPSSPHPQNPPHGSKPKGGPSRKK